MKKLVFVLLSVATFASSGIRAAASEVSEQSKRNVFMQRINNAVLTRDFEGFKSAVKGFKSSGYNLTLDEKRSLIKEASIEVTSQLSTLENIDLVTNLQAASRKIIYCLNLLD